MDTLLSTTFLSTGVKVIGHKSCLEITFYGCENSTERKFLEHSRLRSESSRGAKVPWNESSLTFESFRALGANVSRNKSSTGARVLSMDFLLLGTKVQRNEKSRYLLVSLGPSLISSVVFRLLLIQHWRHIWDKKCDTIVPPNFKVLMKKKANHIVKQTFCNQCHRMSYVQRN